MEFKLIQILETMEAFYRLPRNKARFDKYLSILQDGETQDMKLPIAGYNPMGKETVVLEQLLKLKELNAEQITEEVIGEVNSALINKSDHVISVVINLADDIGGAWTNRYTTDYTSKFDLGATLKRNFCTPYFWTSEVYTAESIRQCITEGLYRSWYCAKEGRPITLKDHVYQERDVLSMAGYNNISSVETDPFLKKFYLEHCGSEDYSLIFNFLYGDEASSALNYKTNGIPKLAGYKYIKSLVGR